MKTIKTFLKTFELQMKLEKKSEKVIFGCAFTLLVIYMEFALYAQNSFFGHRPRFLSLFYAAALIPICFWGVKLCSKISLSSRSANAENRMSGKKFALFMLIVFTLTFLIYFLWQVAYWPGSFSYDSINQYSQVINGKYNDWHPVLHTWLFFLLPYHIFHDPAGIVTMQLIWFSAAITYLLGVLYAKKCSRQFILFAWLYIVGNPNTAQIMLYPWKDSAMSLLSLVLFTQLIQIYTTDGGWLKKWYNMAAFSVIAFLTVSMRQNAVLLVAPIFVVLFLSLGTARKHIIMSAAYVIMAIVLLRGPIFSFANVGRFGGITVQTVGFPMTILSNVYVYDRDALSEDGRAFMDSLATRDEWENNYITGSFNSIRGVNGTFSRKINAESAITILKYTAEAALNSPLLAWDAFVELTNMVWRYDGGDGWIVGELIADNPYGIVSNGNEQLQTVLGAHVMNSWNYATKYLFNYIGTIILFMLFIAVAKIGDGNLSKAMIVLAPICYDFGTMLLLAGADFRFFHFNFVIVVPLLYTILAEKDPLNA